MSETSIEGRDCCHDRPPQYDSSNLAQDLLTSIIENEHTFRRLLQRGRELEAEQANLFEEIESKKPMQIPLYDCGAESFHRMGQIHAEMAQVCAGMENVVKERAAHNTDLYTALDKLTDTEFNRTYDSLKQDPNRQMRHGLAQDYKYNGECQDRHSVCNSKYSSTTKPVERANDYISDSPCFYDRLAELSSTVDKLNKQLGLPLLSHDTAISRVTDDATVKSPVSFWKRIFKTSGFKDSARP